MKLKPVITFRLSKELIKELQSICASEDRSASEIIREAIKRYLAIYKFRTLRNKVLPFAEAQGVLTDEDVFKLIS
ncbi:MAG: hypothetical protein A3F16_06765 [Deltaproteobacteria bacterium RIFCSPHIGHO2_12_FULL_43_9]|nr:MAG: hypothetical protein A3F16_06765 [Deltaproteobacteria bacterium RIFCSPHIGHO2_12_FULL_43_9]